MLDKDGTPTPESRHRSDASNRARAGRFIATAADISPTFRADQYPLSAEAQRDAVQKLKSVVATRREQDLSTPLGVLRPYILERHLEEIDQDDPTTSIWIYGFKALEDVGQRQNSRMRTGQPFNVDTSVHFTRDPLAPRVKMEAIFRSEGPLTLTVYNPRNEPKIDCTLVDSKRALGPQLTDLPPQPTRAAAVAWTIFPPQATRHQRSFAIVDVYPRIGWELAIKKNLHVDRSKMPGDIKSSARDALYLPQRWDFHPTPENVTVLKNLIQRAVYGI